MTIKEMENMLDMPRANIRYYEQEGLISPQRQKNGYRDYSEQDLIHLKKVKLLRELGVSLGDIKKLQNEELSLPEEMRQQIRAIELQQKKKDRAKAICTDICEGQVSYQQLDADKYLYGAFQDLNACSTEAEIDVPDYFLDGRPANIPPIRRFLARELDILLLFEISVCILSVLHINYLLVLPLLCSLSALLFIGFFIEPFCIHFAGTTIGKWIFGLYIMNMDGRRLSYRAAFWRTVKVYFFGMGLGIPVLSWYCMYKSYLTVRDGWNTAWDDELEYIQNPSFLRRKRSHFTNCSWCYAWFAAVIIISFTATYGCTLYAQVPANRGNITLEEFVKNYNQIARYLGYSDYFYQLKPDGTFYTSEEIYQLRTEKVAMAGQVAVIDVFDEYEFLNFDYSLDGKFLKRVALHANLTNYKKGDYIVYPRKQMAIAAIAFAGAQDKVGFWGNERGKMMDKLLGASFGEGFAYEMGGMDIVCDLKSSGFGAIMEFAEAEYDKNSFYLDFEVGKQ